MTTEEGIEDRNVLWDRILDEQFDLSYYVKGISYSDTESMPVLERREFYARLIKRKVEEKDAREKAIADAQANAGNVKKSSTTRPQKYAPQRMNRRR